MYCMPQALKQTRSPIIWNISINLFTPIVKLTTTCYFSFRWQAFTDRPFIAKQGCDRDILTIRHCNYPAETIWRSVRVRLRCPVAARPVLNTFTVWKLIPVYAQLPEKFCNYFQVKLHFGTYRIGDSFIRLPMAGVNARMWWLVRLVLWTIYFFKHMFSIPSLFIWTSSRLTDK